MSFVQISFLAFFVIVLVVYWGLGSVLRAGWTVRAQNAWLLLTSGVFYGWVHPWFLLLLWGSTLLDFGVGRAMARWPTRRRAFLIISLTGNLGLLALFKYLGFFSANILALLDALGVQHSMSTVQLFLPVGISFYTFQTMGYSIDVYRGRLKPERDLLSYAVYVGLFCQLVAGPVERAENLLPQARRARRLDLSRMASGLSLVMWGAVKKICVADTIAPYVDKVFSLPHPSVWLLLLGGVAFSVQILADFSGYTDIARGTARMLGFELRLNFLRPYLANSPSQFWRRWHVSFSSWIRDYLYIPLGGSRGSFWRVTLVTFTTMLLAGFWHGAAWNFLLWGAFHAVIIVLYRLVAPRLPASVVKHPGSRVGAVGLMYALSCLGWIIFRQQDLEVLGRVLTAPQGVEPAWQAALAVSLAGITLLCALPQLLALIAERWLQHRVTAWRLPLRTTGWALALVAIYFFAQERGNDFIYFQF